MPFQPKPFGGGDHAALAQHIISEFQNVAQAAKDNVDSIGLNALAVAPKKPRTGMLAYATGAWNPGSGSGLYVYTGSAWSFLGPVRTGTAVLAAGTVVVALASVTASSRIQLTSQVDGGTPGFLRVTARVVGVSFTITSSSNLDTSTVAYVVNEP